jgi:mannose-1-phosphate guanylyltransferase/mannose-6-phosphate isomerase
MSTSSISTTPSSATASPTFAAVERPWGSYATLEESSGYKIKRIQVNPGASLSLQLHRSRSEHWVVVSGVALIQIGDRKDIARPGEYRFIPCGEQHRLSNPGTDVVVLIEVQRGDYLGEDDIVRIEDIYGRAESHSS